MGIKKVAIVPAAGLGTRFKAPERKQLTKVAGIPLLLYTLKALHAIESISEIIPVLRKEDMQQVRELCESCSLRKVQKMVEGGNERQDSVYSGLRQIKEDCLVLIHDGVRPLVSADLMERLFKEVEDFDGVIPGLLIGDTVKEVGSDGTVLSTVKRERFMTVQTPQIFRYDVLKRAYERAYEDGFYATDDAKLVERIGGRIKVIEGDPLNIKVTKPEDAEMVEYILSKKNH
jgi:2-C-methyl-D-erythritol 4-phosphate cytidylyltransferase